MIIINTHPIYYENYERAANESITQKLMTSISTVWKLNICKANHLATDVGTICMQEKSYLEHKRC